MTSGRDRRDARRRNHARRVERESPVMVTLTGIMVVVLILGVVVIVPILWGKP
jgi:hypothetical protein